MSGDWSNICSDIANNMQPLQVFKLKRTTSKNVQTDQVLVFFGNEQLEKINMDLLCFPLDIIHDDEVKRRICQVFLAWIEN